MIFVGRGLGRVGVYDIMYVDMDWYIVLLWLRCWFGLQSSKEEE